MPTVEMNRIARQQSPHDRRDWHMSCLNKQMKMVGDDRPSKTVGRSLRQNSTEPFDKIVSVCIIRKYLPPLNSAAYDVV